MMTMLRSYILLSIVLRTFVAGSPVTLHRRDITATCQGTVTTNCASNTVSATTKTGVMNGQTVTETFFPTTLSDLSTVTAETTITTTDNTGATVAAIVGAAGAGFLVYLGAQGGGVLLEPPELPTPTITNTVKTPSSTSSTTSTSSTEVDTQTLEQPGIFYTNSIDPGPTLISVPIDIKACYPEGDTDPNFDLNFAQTTIDDFCKGNADKDVGYSTLDQVFSVGAGRNVNISVSTLPLGCDVEAGQTRLTEKSCNYYLEEAVNGCDTESNTIKHGGNIQNGCLVYSVAGEVSDGDLRCTPNDLPTLPGLPGAPTDTVTYDGETGMNRDEALKWLGEFCDAIVPDNSRDVKPGEKDNLRIYYNPSRGNTQMNVSLTYSEQVDCAQSGDKAIYHTDRDSCKRLMGRVIDSCNTGSTGSYGKYGGILTEGCGVFAIQTENVEPIECNADGVTVPPEIQTAAIDQFCSRGYKLDPAFKFDPTKYYNEPPAGAAWDDFFKDGNRIKTELAFASLPQNTGCQKDQTKFNVDGDECKRRLHSIAGRCEKGGKMGAQQQEGCVTWDMQYSKV
ncbi:Hypothetical protein D9617_4g001780 [Elsinoe fawcettii]|nr:Hypothetical protein D9617_4g001780 [Elsinoe fawcettii]